jgi:ketosteroid isomerase-like protein
VTLGREAIQAVFEQMVKKAIHVQLEEALATLRHGEFALTGTRSAEAAGTRSQVARRQPDGTWLWIMDRPELPSRGR